ncbi:MAG: hypothetical protein HY650_06765 [Acidobacteria bacterium]|nr:hypothetical protein [Acidobacteriota bacterium]
MKYAGSIRMLALVILLFSILPAATAPGQRRRGGAWDYLGEAHVDGGVDHDKISVTDKRGTFRAIQLRVHEAPIEFRRVVVHFESGEDTEVEIKDRIAAGGRTRVIDLPGGERFLRSVEIWYERARWGPRRPSVRLFGRR